MKSYHRSASGFGALCLAILLALSAAPFSNAIAATLTAAQKKIIAEAVKSKLKDPDSAQFQWPDLVEPSNGDDNVAYCGQVNAKNSYGGYTGFIPFSVFLMNYRSKKMEAIPELIGDAGIMASATLSHCADQGYHF